MRGGISRRQLLVATTGALDAALVGCASSGNSRVVWQQDAPLDSGIASLAASGGTLYAGSNSPSQGSLYAFDAATGTQRWEYDGGTNGLVHFSVETPDDQQPMVYALRADTGRPAWTATAARRTTSLADLYHGPFLTGSTLCLPNNATGTVYGLDASSGTRRWQSTGPAADGSSCAAGSLLLTGCRHDGLSAVDGSTGKERWQFPGSGPVGAGPAVAGGIAYVGTASDGPPVDKLYALRL